MKLRFRLSHLSTAIKMIFTGIELFAVSGTDKIE